MLPFYHLDRSGSPDNRRYNCPVENVGEQSRISENHISHGRQQMPFFPGFERFDELCFNDGPSEPSPFQLSQEECTKLRNIHSEMLELFAPEEEETSPTLSSFRILNNCRSNLEDQNSEKVKVSGSNVACSKVGGASVNEIIRLAGEKFIKSRTPRVDDLSELNQGLHDDKTEDVELVIQNLLLSAEKIREQQFEDARSLLNHCYEYSSNKGNPVQRLVYYFCAALREKIDLEMGVTTPKVVSPEFEKAVKCPISTSLSLHQRIPFCQVMQFTGIQAIIENVSEAKRIHIIDLDIKYGTHCSVFIQDLASRHVCPVEHLRITAVGTKSNSLPTETGKRLANFAKSVNLSFSFHVVTVADILDLNENQFELDSDEVTAVYSPYFLWTLISQQDRLECLMKVMRTINPSVMVVSETEVNHNSPMFVNRFVEALFFFGAYFDCFGEYMDPDDPERFTAESIFGQGIQNIVAAEGKDRTLRQVKNNVWVQFFGQFNMVQKELSRSSLYQASLVSKNFNCEASCSLKMDGKSLILGWKGTSILSLSAWEFS
ncbi:DELLA protein GAI1 [Heracleum sosnowskyi]|uniref:DELLA protein GAI1 n=1 Tax=Heracleum sosnowskyi TaxID=360622 RepID=A0AAD8GMY1_9APIA|nr:DELLA protein GAI1 [Heracleum sosnowskyi]